MIALATVRAVKLQPKLDIRRPLPRPIGIVTDRVCSVR
jgi:hypothetical protein